MLIHLPLILTFFKLSAAHRADCIDIGSLTEVGFHLHLKHSSTRWVTLKKVCVRLLEQFENLKRYSLEFDFEKNFQRNGSVQKKSRIMKERADSSVFIIHYLYCKWFWTLPHYVLNGHIYRNGPAYKNSDEQVCEI